MYNYKNKTIHLDQEKGLKEAIKAALLEAIKSDSQKPDIKADAAVRHIQNTEYDEHRPNKADMKHMKATKPLASVKHADDYTSHLYHTITHTIIHHGNSDSREHSPYDGYHKIKGYLSPDEFRKAMKKLN